MNKFDKEEYYEIANELQRYHEIFATLWKITTPRFTNEVPTAAVAFNAGGGCIDFMINEEYWNSLDYYTQEFVICHEMLHVILSHGQRMMPFRDKYTPDTLNIALDLAVNHLLTASFGFNRFYIQGWDKLCWCDTVLKDLDLDPNKAFEYYINKVQENLQKVDKKVVLVGHDYLQSFDDKANSSIRNATNEISKTLDEKGQKEQDQQIKDELNQSLMNGLGMSKEETNLFTLFVGDTIKVKKIKRWENVLDKYIHKAEKEREITQWIRTNRRLAFMSSDLLLPSDAEVIDRDYYKYDIWLFLDYSGSCASLKPLFFNASKTFDPRKFTIKKLAHTTEVAEFKDNEVKVYGGGTAFTCIENYIQNQIAQKKIPHYPDAVFHFTDGCGDHFKPEYPERWYVFLTKRYQTKTYYPPGVNFFELEDFVENYRE